MGRIVYEPAKPVKYTHLPMRELGNKRPVQENEVLVYEMDAYEEHQWNRFVSIVRSTLGAIYDTICTAPSVMGAGIATYIGVGELLNPYTPVSVPVFAPIELSVVEPLLNQIGMVAHYTSKSVLIMGCVVITLHVIKRLKAILTTPEDSRLDTDIVSNWKILAESAGILIIYYLLRLI